MYVGDTWESTQQQRLGRGRCSVPWVIRVWEGISVERPMIGVKISATNQTRDRKLILAVLHLILYECLPDISQQVFSTNRVFLCHRGYNV
jgi:hypothetical protein